MLDNEPRWIRYVGWMVDVLLFVAVVMLCLIVIREVTPKVQAHTHNDVDYGTWKQPGSGLSCCNGRKTENGQETGDCGPTKAYWDGKTWMVLFQGRYIRVPPERVLKTANPDGNAHLCAVPYAFTEGGVFVYCFMPPEAKF